MLLYSACSSWQTANRSSVTDRQLAYTVYAHPLPRPRIKAERKETVHKRSETGILNKRAVEDRTYQISMQNFRANPIKLLVYDQLPVSKTADIVVNQGPFSDKPATSDKDSGKLSWNIELGPKAKKVIEFSYSVEWPKGKEIAGDF